MTLSTTKRGLNRLMYMNPILQ